MKYTPLIIGLGLVITVLTCVGIWYISTTWEMGKFYLVVGALSTIGASYLASLFIEER